MLTPTWIKWEPIANLPKRLYLYELKDNANGLTITLVEKQNSPPLTIHFNNYYSYKNTDEGNLLTGNYEIEKGSVKWSLYTVENSSYLQWLHGKSVEWEQQKKLINYIIGTPNEIVDILSSEIPQVQWN